MFKKIIFILVLGLIIFIGIDYYNSQKTVECWWGVLYPSLSFIAVEDEKDTKVSTLDTNYYYINNEDEPVKIKIAILEWFKNHF